MISNISILRKYKYIINIRKSNKWLVNKEINNKIPLKSLINWFSVLLNFSFFF